MSAAATTPAASASVDTEGKKKSPQDQFNDFCEFLDEKLLKYPSVQQLKEKTGVRPAYFALGAAVLFLLFVLFGVGAAAVCNIVGFVYPLYGSFKAIKSPAKGDDTHWLTYWIVYGWFAFIESFTDILLKWIPFYYALKVLFLIWCFLPQTRGAETVYKRFLHPLFIKYERQLDAAMEEVEGEASKLLGSTEGKSGKKVE